MHAYLYYFPLSLYRTHWYNDRMVTSYELARIKLIRCPRRKCRATKSHAARGGSSVRVSQMLASQTAVDCQIRPAPYEVCDGGSMTPEPRERSSRIGIPDLIGSTIEEG